MNSDGARCVRIGLLLWLGWGAAVGYAAESSSSLLDSSRFWSESLRREERQSELLPLTTPAGEVLALYHHAETGALAGGVIILPDLDNHPDWPGVVQQLRMQLPRYGWSTLSLPLQVGAVTATAELTPTTKPSPLQPLQRLRTTTPPLIQAALAAMERFKVTHLVLIGHGMGARLAVDFMKENPQSGFKGLILLSMDGSEVAELELDSVPLLRTITAPILDIYGGRDLAGVVESARRRKNVAVTAPPGEARTHFSATDFAANFNSEQIAQITYRQIRIEGADHQFWGSESLVLKRIVGWLRHYTPAAAI